MNNLILRIAFRNLKRHGKFSVLNILGLCIGFTFINLIALFVVREYTFDRFHKKADSIYRMEVQVKNDDGTIKNSSNITVNQVEALKTILPGLSNITFLNYSYFDWDQGAWLTFEGNSFQLHRMAFTNDAFADVFSFPVIAGNLKEALNDPHAMIITQDNAQKIFEERNPVGEVVLLNSHPVTIKAVIDASSFHSSIPFSGLINYQAASYFTDHRIDDYSNLPFFEINPKTDFQRLAEISKNVFLKDIPADQKNSLSSKVKINFFPLTKSYFKEGEPFDPLLHGNRVLAVVILAIGILILMLAIINYINLAFASSFKRHKELAIRSISGSGRRSLVLQFLFEGILISSIAGVFSLLLSGALIPWFNKIIAYPLSTQNLLNPVIILIFPVIVILTGLASGIFPALITTRSTLLNQIKGSLPKTNKYAVWKYLVLFQMFISIALIIGTIAIVRQIHFTRTTDMGFRVNNIITLPIYKLGEKRNSFLQTIENNGQTEAFSLSSTYLNTFNEWGGSLSDGAEKKEISYFVIHANANFLNLTGINLTKGRNFEDGNTSDLNSCLVNETAIAQLGIKDPLSATISDCPIVGVVKDFHIQSLHYRIGPVVIFNASEDRTGIASVRFIADNSRQVAAYMSFLRKTWTEMSLDQPFEFEFLDQRLKNLYLKDESLMKAFTSFSILAVLIACFGLFGLVSFISETKIKEIGIRKVNGAKISEVLIMLNKDFVKWVAIAFMIATPVAYYAMSKWLESFAYKTSLSWWIFALAGLLAMGIALLTVSWQSWKAATRNPVEALRYE